MEKKVYICDKCGKEFKYPSKDIYCYSINRKRHDLDNYEPGVIQVDLCLECANDVFKNWKKLPNLD